MRLHLRACVLVATSVLVLAPRPAFADPAPEEAAVAREQFKMGLDAVEAGDWERARITFLRSYEMWPRPLTLLNLAGAQFKSGKLVASASSYRQFLRIAVGPATEHKPAAEQALAQVEARLPHVKLGTSSALATTDVLAIDGSQVANAVVGVPLPIDPGEHKVTVSRGGAAVAEAAFEIAEAETKDVAIDVPAPRPVVAVVAPAPAPARPDWYQTAPERRAEKRNVLSSPWFWGAVGVVVVGSATTAILLATSSSSSGGAVPYTGNLPPGRVGVQ
jgi:hypothetical protein